MTTIVWVVIGAIALIVLWFITTYNRMIVLRNRIVRLRRWHREQERQGLRRRHGLAQEAWHGVVLERCVPTSLIGPSLPPGMQRSIRNHTRWNDWPLWMCKTTSPGAGSKD